MMVMATVREITVSFVYQHALLPGCFFFPLLNSKHSSKCLAVIGCFQVKAWYTIEPCTGWPARQRARLCSIIQHTAREVGQLAHMQRFCSPHPSPSHQPFRLPCWCKLSIAPSPDLTLASPVGELIIFNMQIAEFCFGLCRQQAQKQDRPGRTGLFSLWAWPGRACIFLQCTGPSRIFFGPGRAWYFRPVQGSSIQYQKYI